METFLIFRRAMENLFWLLARTESLSIDKMFVFLDVSL